MPGVVAAPSATAAGVSVTCTNYTTGDGLASNGVAGVFADGDTIYAATDAGLSISTDAGINWTNYTASDGLGNDRTWSVYADGASIYVGTFSGLSISSDGGANWVTRTKANSGLADNVVRGVVARGSTIYSAMMINFGISSDDGLSWSNYSSGTGLASMWVQGVSESAGTVYVATTAGLSITSDNGATWVSRGTADGLPSRNVQATDASGSRVFAATGGGLGVSSDAGATWSQRTTSDGLGSNGTYGVSVGGSIVAVGTYSGLSISTDGGASFTNYTTSDGLGADLVGSVYVDGSTVYAATSSGLGVCTVESLGSDALIDPDASRFAFHFLTSGGGPCLADVTVVDGQTFTLPTSEVACTPEGTELVGWSVPRQAGSFSPGGRVKVSGDQWFRAVAMNPRVRVTYDANVGMEARCLAGGADVEDESGRHKVVEVERAGRLALSAPCTPAGWELAGWTTQPTVEGAHRNMAGALRAGPGDEVPGTWALPPDPVNDVHLYAIWAPAGATKQASR